MCVNGTCNGWSAKRTRLVGLGHRHAWVHICNQVGPSGAFLGQGFPHILHFNSSLEYLDKNSVSVSVLCHLPLFATPWTMVVCQAPLAREFSRHEYWSGLPFPTPGDSSWPRDQNWILYHCTTWEALIIIVFDANFLSCFAHFKTPHQMEDVNYLIAPGRPPVA